MEKPNLIWETITYSPGILYTIEATSKGLRTSLCRDMSRFHFFLESQFGYTNVRESDFTQCKSFLKSELVAPGLLFYLPQFDSDLTGSVQLKSFDWYTQQVQVCNVPQLDNLSSKRYNGVQICTLDKNTLFISGGLGTGEYVVTNCYTLNISTTVLIPAEDMNESRCFHGLQKMAQKIFVFGGNDGEQHTESAEVYDIEKNYWEELPDMPIAAAGITCVRVQNYILISSLKFRLLSYDIDNEAYTYVGQQNNTDVVQRSIVSSKEKLYLFEDAKIFEMTRQYETLDTVTCQSILTCYQRFTNAAGVIFLLDSDGKVYCFDPLGERKLTEIQDLDQD